MQLKKLEKKKEKEEREREKGVMKKEKEKEIYNSNNNNEYEQDLDMEGGLSNEGNNFMGQYNLPSMSNMEQANFAQNKISRTLSRQFSTDVFFLFWTHLFLFFQEK